MGQAISKLTIKGYKSIRSLENFDLRNLNILIGPNGGGKSNFVSFFEFLRAVSEEKGLPNFYVERKGGADRLLYWGSKVTQSIKVELIINSLPEYKNEFCVTVNDKFSSSSQIISAGWNRKPKIQDVEKNFSGFSVYHFHDTSDFASVRRHCSKRDYEYLRPDASNLAAFLLFLRKKHERQYQHIRETVQLAAPFFDDFLLRDSLDNPDETLLEWRQKGSDYPFHPSQISDGTLRFICLATALLQPNPPSTILLDEPELGLHPYALTLLAGLIQKASKQTQVIVSTQSAPLIDHFEPEDIVVVERQNGESIFKRLNRADLKVWLEDYSLGELWQKNVFGGRPARE
jgi:predicted ATPase